MRGNVIPTGKCQQRDVAITAPTLTSERGTCLLRVIQKQPMPQPERSASYRTAARATGTLRIVGRGFSKEPGKEVHFILNRQ